MIKEVGILAKEKEDPGSKIPVKILIPLIEFVESVPVTYCPVINVPDVDNDKTGFSDFITIEASNDPPVKLTKNLSA